MAHKKLKVGIIGCGAIGSAIAKYCVDSLSEKIEIKALFDIDKIKAASLKKRLSKDISVAASLDKLIELSDLVVEAASVNISAKVLKKAIEKKRDIMIMSAGGIIENGRLLSLARKRGCRVYIPSGAISGLDGIKAATLSRIDEVILTTKKPKEALRGAPYIEENSIDLDSIETERLLFEGSAKEAVEAFPQNVNVCATLSLAGIGARKTKVRVICSPESKRNIHEIELKGEFGKIFIKAENVPSPDNPKTSYLAALSAIATLRGIVDTVRIGT